MIKRAIITVMGIVALSVSAQQQQQAFGNMLSNVSLGNQAYVQRQSNPVLASNKGNLNNQAKTVQTNKAIRRAPVQQNVARNINPQVQPLVQNDDMQQVLVNLSENNFGNEMKMIQQIAAVELPALQIGNGNMEINAKINLPKLNLNLNRHVVKSRAASNSTKHKLLQIEKKLKKINRKLAAKLCGHKRLKIKVDSCFNW